ALVLMDLQMPEMDGFEATAMIRSKASAVLKHDIIIVAMTANAMQEDRDKCIAAGMDDYISKPIIKQKLFHIIEKYLADPAARHKDVPDAPVASGLEVIF
ncbi:MAG: response regulator, partial [Pseudomonadota bacterium]